MMIRHGCVIQLVLAVLTAFVLKLFFNHVGTDENTNFINPDQQTPTPAVNINIQPSGTVRNNRNSQPRSQYISVSKTDVTFNSVEDSSKNSFESSDKIFPTEKPVTIKESKDFDQLRSRGSSVWCHGFDHTNRICKFRNLCYSPHSDSFIFYHSVSSILHGIPRERFNPALVDSSTIRNHNALYFNYVDLPVIALSEVNNDEFAFVKTPSHLIGRFNGGNLMHVIHDELIPLFYTYSHLLHGSEGKDNFLNLQVVFFDRSTTQEYKSLYDAVVRHTPMSRGDMLKRNQSVCFSELHVGLHSDLVWYDFGLYNPQGPIADTVMTGNDLRYFGKFLRTNLAAPPKTLFKNYILLLSRKENRLILNENELLVAIAQKFNVKAISASLATHTISEIVHLVSHAQGIIGVHGSLLVMAMFLPRGSFLLELFPYGINPMNYTPYRTQCNLPGMGISYAAWRNTHMEASVAHPDFEKDLGGIEHLSITAQQEILKRDTVPAHLCCNDPAWLFRIYQDTSVNILEVLELLQKLRNDKKHQTVEDGLFPAPVAQIQCDLETEESELSLLVSWSAPMNIKYLQYFEVKYEFWLQIEKQAEYKSWFTTKSSMRLPVYRNTTYVLWIRCIIDDRIGPFNEYVQCTT